MNGLQVFIRLQRLLGSAVMGAHARKRARACRHTLRPIKSALCPLRPSTSASFSAPTKDAERKEADEWALIQITDGVWLSLRWKFEKHYCPQSKLNVLAHNGARFEPRRFNWPCFWNLKCSAQRRGLPGWHQCVCVSARAQMRRAHN